MEAPPDTVTIEVLDHAKPVTARSPLDRSTQVTEPGAWLSCVHGVTLRKLGCLQEPGGNRPHLAHGHADPGIGEVAVQLCRHVKVHEVAGVELASERGDAVGSFVVHADARRAGKSVGYAGSGPRSVAAEHLSAYGVEF